MMLIKLQNISSTTVDVPGKGMVLRSGGTMWANDLTAELQTAIEGGFLEIIDQMSPGGEELPDGAVTPQKLSAALLDRYVVVDWSDPEAVNPTTQNVSIQLKNLIGTELLAAHTLRITCDEQATMTVGEHGDALSGDGTSDLIARTDSSGQLDLVVSCDQAITVSMAAGPTQMSPMLDCRDGCEILFT